MKFSKIKERLKGPKDERGGGLLTLLGISSIVGITALSVAAAATFGTIMTHENLASKQAKNSADSGVSEAVYKLSNGVCDESITDSTVNYSYKVYHSAALTAPTTIDAAGVTLGCPSNTDRWVLIKSEGKGKNDTKKDSVATFKWSEDAKIIPQVITGEQISLTSTEITGSGSGLKLRPTIYSKSGSVSCVDTLETFQKNANINADSPTSALDCAVTGDVRITGDADLSSANVEGDACATGFLSNASNIRGETLEGSATCGATGSMYGYKPNFAANTIAITSDDCANFAKFKQIIEENYTEPTILDATSCGADFTNMLSTPDDKYFNISSNELTIVTDEETSIRNLNVHTSSGPSSLSFVIPSDSSNSTESICSTDASLNLENVVYKEGANGMFYSPCTTNLKHSDISGQVYGGKNVVIENTSIHYYPIELVNADSIVGAGNFQKHLVRVF